MFPIFDKLGGQEAALQALAMARDGKLQGRMPSKYTLKLWRANGRMPGAVVLALGRVCEARGVPYEMRDFDLTREVA